jgi:hypothetical protein
MGGEAEWCALVRPGHARHNKLFSPWPGRTVKAPAQTNFKGSVSRQ